MRRGIPRYLTALFSSPREAFAALLHLPSLQPFQEGLLPPSRETRDLIPLERLRLKTPASRSPRNQRLPWRLSCVAASHGFSVCPLIRAPYRADQELSVAPGMERSQVLAILNQAGIKPTVKGNEVSWEEKGHAPKFNESFSTWTARLTFRHDKLENICVDCK